MISTKSSPSRAIVLGVSGHPRAVAAVRSLGRAGIPVVGVKREICLQDCHSRHLRERFVVDPTPAKLLPFLESQGRSGGGVLFAVDDDYLILVAQHFDSLSRLFTLTMPPWEILERVMDHRCLYEIARGLGLNTPKSYKPHDEADLREIVASLDLVNHEYLLKTIPGTAPAEVSNGRCTKVAGHDPATVLANCLEIYSRLGEFPLIAEVVPGEANQCIGVTMVVDRTHTPMVTYGMKRLKLQTYSRGGFVHPYELGSNVYCESVRDQEAFEASTRLTRAAGYYGLVTSSSGATRETRSSSSSKPIPGSSGQRVFRRRWEWILPPRSITSSWTARPRRRGPVPRELAGSGPRCIWSPFGAIGPTVLFAGI